MPRISRFSPNWSDPDALEAITVAREDLIADAVEAVRNSSLTKNKHHLLYIGPRGSGKTHLVTLVHHRVTQMKDVMETLRIAWLNEDETSDTLLSFLLRVHRALAREYPKEFPAESREVIYDLSDHVEAAGAIADLLLKQLNGRTLLILVENLDALFTEFDDGEQKRWRALIQNHPQFCTVATAQRLFQEVSNRDAPFFGFFDVHHFKPFSVEDAAELLSKIARENKDPDLSAFVTSPRGRARIRALHHLTGGNQRLFIILSEFIDCESLESLVGPFEDLVDEQLTPYYQERLRWLPTLQRKIVEFLCAVGKPQPVKAIARQLFATHQTISSQLMVLRRMGYLVSRKRGRESLYELAEPLMRLSYEVKEAKGRTPLRFLVDFLRIWYDREDLRTMVQRVPLEAVLTRQYYIQASIENESSGNLRLKILRQEAEGIDPTSCRENSLGLFRDLAKESGDAEDILNYALALSMAGKHAEACSECSDVIALSRVGNDEFDRANYLRALCFEELGKFDEAVADYSRVLEREDVDVLDELRPWAVFGRAVVFRLKGESEKALSEFSELVDQSGTPVELKCWAIVNRADLFVGLEDLEAAFSECSSLLDQPDTPRKFVTVAHRFLAFIEMKRGNWEEAERRLRSGFAGAKVPDSEMQGIIPGYIFVVLNSGQTRAVWAPRIDMLVKVFAESSAMSRLAAGLGESLYGLKHTKLSPEGLAEWHALWAERAATYPELELPARLLRTAIGYFTAGEDESVLLDLPSEERRILAQALGLEEDED